MMQIYHNSQDLKYRSPFGAVLLGSEISLRLSVKDFCGSVSAKIRLWTDKEGEKWIEMENCDSDDGLIFTGSFQVPNEPCLVWYSFFIEDEMESIFYGNNKEKLGGIGEVCDQIPSSYQITVYKDYQIPSWYKNSIAYQIFPDRFHRGSDWVKRSADCLSDQTKNGPKTLLRQDWNDEPRYIKNEKGEVTHWDFFGGTLQGITEKLDYLESLGIGTIYLNPIFKALSNHRYDTSDFLTIDPRLGDDESFRTLCAEAEKRGISIILDGVFNHTGNDSIYFDAYQNQNTNGAFNNPSSPYSSWYQFKNEEQTEYESWWGVRDLPALNKDNPEYQNFIYGSKNSVIRHWLQMGAKGWRLDVADELTDEFIAGIKQAVKEEVSDGLLLGEVWEDASNKVSYGKMRSYLLGDELDCAMNYPLRTALLDFINGKISSCSAQKILMSLYENYPKPAIEASFNLLSSHDRARLLSMLSGFDESSHTSDSLNIISDEALRKLWPLLVVQMTLPGVPCVYYGDEAGLTGGLDPDNRKPYPWGMENKDTFNMYRSAIALRKEWPVFVSGNFSILNSTSDNVFAYKRSNEDEEMLIFINRSLSCCENIVINSDCDLYDLLSATSYRAKDGFIEISISPCGALILRKDNKLTQSTSDRSCGVLCHITSLPSQWGQGDLGKEAEKFILKLKEMGQSYLQILPLNPVDEYDSPYATSSAFAGNIYLISPEKLLEDGYLSKEEYNTALEKAKSITKKEDRSAFKELKLSLLKSAFSHFTPSKDYQNFLDNESYWLDDFCKFEVLKKHYKGKAWQTWPKKYRERTAKLPEDLQEEADFFRFCQYVFAKQWKEFKKFANKNGIKIIGDLPFYVGLQSADVWSKKDLFQLNEEGFGLVSAGVPPDYFSKDGQIWNNPLYNWRKMEKDGYSWWLERLKQAFSRYDLLRLDHFRGFEQFWSIPAGKKSLAGCWKFGPGLSLFELAKEKFGQLPILAEDLGDITIQVKNLLSACGFLGTDVFQFSFHERLFDFKYNAKDTAVLYSGTHDNQTLQGFLKENKIFYDGKVLSAKKALSLLYESVAPIVILPLQDLFELDDSARMNVPGKAENNWKWQFSFDLFEDNKVNEIKELVRKTNR